MANVLIIDDHPIVRRGLKEILKEGPDLTVTEIGEARAALSFLKQQRVDLVVLDLDLPDLNGLELLKTIKQEWPKLPILVLSVYPEDQFAVRVLKAGASGFLSKDVAPDHLLSSVRKILRGGKYISERVAIQLLQNVKGDPGSHLHECLSDREFQILCLLGEGKRIKEIAQALSLSSPTVSTYRARILDKMAMRTTAELVKYAIQNGIANPR